MDPNDEGFDSALESIVKPTHVAYLTEYFRENSQKLEQTAAPQDTNIEVEEEY